LKRYLLVLFATSSLAEQINFDCENVSNRTYWYDEDGNYKRTYDSKVFQDTTIMFDTNKKILLNNFGQEGPYTESEIFIEWLTVYGEEDNNYVESKFNRVTGVLTASQYYSMNSKPKQGIVRRSIRTFNCKKIKKLL
tara:strand:- start:830 stop:1240 length:411 start_codon:yes stop_codon:yes gene_type:complete